MKISRTYLVLVLGAALVGVSGYVLARFIGQGSLPDGLIQANGRIEGDHVTVASKFPGRIVELHAREGAKVTKGAVLIRLDDVQMRAKVDQAARLVDTESAQVEAAHTQLAVLNLEVPLSIEAASAKVASANAAVAKARAVEYEARQDVGRMRALIREQAVSQQQLDQAEARWKVAVTEISVAKASLDHATKELGQAELGWQRIRAKEAEVAALERQRDQADAALAEARSILQDLTIVAPADGTVTTRMVDVGEVVAGGAPLLELVDLDKLYLQVYVPEVQIGKIGLDLPARIYTDAFPDQPFEATVRYIASKAEFTPKEVQTPDERVKLIYAVRLYVKDNPEHRLTPGLPADAIIRWMDNAAWVRPR
ncbi:putative Secretion protein HlyD [Nitrospira japonica]|uniref:Putative Secretion protein HlyD n=1 Tax=Nitrospira japonica TaxID=1325564 RepID=A0A1W1I2P9_9BACT|nr:efflux RND transporter periplasmic adaptor subunit [Nitrospira japonica]SLM47278.1 putative Secretion protein HlyD [Nitrospira japonica]